MADVAIASSMVRSGGEEMLLTGKKDIVTAKVHRQAKLQLLCTNPIRRGTRQAQQLYGRIGAFEARGKDEIDRATFERGKRFVLSTGLFF